MEYIAYVEYMEYMGYMECMAYVEYVENYIFGICGMCGRKTPEADCTQERPTCIKETHSLLETENAGGRLHTRAPYLY